MMKLLFTMAIFLLLTIGVELNTQVKEVLSELNKILESETRCTICSLHNWPY